MLKNFHNVKYVTCFIVAVFAIMFLLVAGARSDVLPSTDTCSIYTEGGINS